MLHLKHQKKNRIIRRIYEINSNGGLPKTGQEISYCLGDDGYYQKGYPLGGDRFIDNGDGATIDLATGLMWVKDPTQIPGGLFASRMYWYDAITACEDLVYAGHDDWRMPNINELMSIIDHSKYGPALDTLFFAYCPDQWGAYWSSTRCASWMDGAWAVYIYDGYKSTYSILWDMTYVRPVRG